MLKSWWLTTKSRTVLLSFILATISFVAGFGTLYEGAHLTGQQNVALSFFGFSFGGKTASATPNTTLLPQNIVPKLPARLIIPSIGVNAAVQSVGLLPSGRIGIPSNFTDVAWYNAGPKPGAIGSSVIDGHLDTARDANAVFAKLSELVVGDVIDVIDQTNQTIRFKVVKTAVYDENDAPLSAIFDQTIKVSRLNLITCDGVWNQAKKSYDKRFVVYSQRI